MVQIEISIDTTEHDEIQRDCFGEKSQTGTRIKLGEGVYAREGRFVARLAEGAPQNICGSI